VPRLNLKKLTDYAVFTHVPRGTLKDWPALTIRVETTYNKTFCGYSEPDGKGGDRKVRGALYNLVADGAKTFDGESKCWFILPSYLDSAIALALRFFAHVYEVEGEKTTNHTTGQVDEQPSLF
jgi:hypothetical protein